MDPRGQMVPPGGSVQVVPPASHLPGKLGLFPGDRVSVPSRFPEFPFSRFREKLGRIPDQVEERVRPDLDGF